MFKNIQRNSSRRRISSHHSITMQLSKAGITLTKHLLLSRVKLDPQYLIKQRSFVWPPSLFYLFNRTAILFSQDLCNRTKYQRQDLGGNVHSSVKSQRQILIIQMPHYSQWFTIHNPKTSQSFIGSECFIVCWSLIPIPDFLFSSYKSTNHLGSKINYSTIPVH